MEEGVSVLSYPVFAGIHVKALLVLEVSEVRDWNGDSMSKGICQCALVDCTRYRRLEGTVAGHVKYPKFGGTNVRWKVVGPDNCPSHQPVIARFPEALVAAAAREAYKLTSHLGRKPSCRTVTAADMWEMDRMRPRGTLGRSHTDG